MLERLHRPADEVAKREAARRILKGDVKQLSTDQASAIMMGLVDAQALAQPPKHVHLYRWLCWTAMLLSVGLFVGGDVAANWLEARGRGQAIDPVTATGWVRLGIKSTWYALPLVVITLLWLVWHFIIGAFKPGMPL